MILRGQNFFLRCFASALDQDRPLLMVDRGRTGRFESLWQHLPGHRGQRFLVNAVRYVYLPAGARFYFGKQLDITLTSDFREMETRVQEPASRFRSDLDVIRQLMEQTLRGV